MNCETFDNLLDPYLHGEFGGVPGKRFCPYTCFCNRCHDLYRAARIKAAGILQSESRPKPSAEQHFKDLQDPFPGMAEPREYKDAPLSFLFILDGRQEVVKIVEPEIDMPFVEGARLIIEEAGSRLCDVIFRTDLKSRRPYELHFSVIDGIRYSAEHILTFGLPVEEDPQLLRKETMQILDRGSVSAWVEMHQSKARLFIRYDSQSRK